MVKHVIIHAVEDGDGTRILAHIWRAAERGTRIVIRRVKGRLVAFYIGSLRP